jgi:hypothetical protein
MSEERQIDYDSVGTIEAHVAVAPSELSIGLDEALDLQPISIRLQRDLIENLKALARLNGLGYQPLIRQVLTRWVDCELKSMLQSKLVNQAAREGEAATEEIESAAMRKAA